MIGFSGVVSETRGISENLQMNLDEKGNTVSMTIENARASSG